MSFRQQLLNRTMDRISHTCERYRPFQCTTGSGAKHAPAAEIAAAEMSAYLYAVCVGTLAVAKLADASSIAGRVGGWLGVCFLRVPRREAPGSASKSRVTTRSPSRLTRRH